MNKLVCVIIGQNCQETIGMCIKSVKDADKIIFLDGGSTDDTLQIVNNKAKILYNEFNKANPNMISEQRNFYLDYLKKAHKNDWAIILDADEVMDEGGIKKLKDLANQLEVGGAYSPRMRHLMYNLGYEDATQEKHFVPNRFFKILDAQKYQDGEHCVLIADNQNMCLIHSVTIWHLGYLGGAWDIKKRYDQQILRNSGHTKEFLNNWNKTHLLGRYKVRPVNPIEIPEIILNHFGLNNDELYFEERKEIEAKHLLDAINWKEEFNLNNALLYGCGFGQRIYGLRRIEVQAIGVELSDYAIKNSQVGRFILKNNILDELDFHNADADFEGIPINGFDLVVAYDILEHLEYKYLDEAINNLIKYSSKNILVSLPYKGTFNCEADPTHIIKEDRDWWVKKFTDKGLKEVKVPEHFLFKEQLLIFEK